MTIVKDVVVIIYEVDDANDDYNDDCDQKINR